MGSVLGLIAALVVYSSSVVAMAAPDLRLARRRRNRIKEQQALLRTQELSRASQLRSGELALLRGTAVPLTTQQTAEGKEVIGQRAVMQRFGVTADWTVVCDFEVDDGSGRVLVDGGSCLLISPARTLLPGETVLVLGVVAHRPVPAEQASGLRTGSWRPVLVAPPNGVVLLATCDREQAAAMLPDAVPADSPLRW